MLPEQGTQHSRYLKTPHHLQHNTVHNCRIASYWQQPSMQLHLPPCLHAHKSDNEKIRIIPERTKLQTVGIWGSELPERPKLQSVGICGVGYRSAPNLDSYQDPEARVKPLGLLNAGPAGNRPTPRLQDLVVRITILSRGMAGTPAEAYPGLGKPRTLVVVGPGSIHPQNPLCTHIYIYIYLLVYLSICLFVHLFMHTHIDCVCVCARNLEGTYQRRGFGLTRKGFQGCCC